MIVSPASSGTVKIDETVATTYPYNKSIANGELVVLEAIPAAGYEFSGWSGKLTGHDNPATVVMDCSKGITAVFSEKEEFSLTIELNGAGSVNPPAGIHSYTKGAVVNIAATPDTGYRFEGWTGGVDDVNSASTTVNVDSDKTVIANFAVITHTLTIEIEGPGSVTPSVGKHSYIEGSIVSVIATPDTGHRFNGWNGDVDDTGSASTTLTVDSDKTIVATFSSIIVTLLLIGTSIAGGIVIIGGIILLLARRRRIHV